jgi:hypothetical protein
MRSGALIRTPFPTPALPELGSNLDQRSMIHLFAAADGPSTVRLIPVEPVLSPARFAASHPTQRLRIAPRSLRSGPSACAPPGTSQLDPIQSGNLFPNRVDKPVPRFSAGDRSQLILLAWHSEPHPLLVLPCSTSLPSAPSRESATVRRGHNDGGKTHFRNSGFISHQARLRTRFNSAASSGFARTSYAPRSRASTHKCSSASRDVTIREGEFPRGFI